MTVASPVLPTPPNPSRAPRPGRLPALVVAVGCMMAVAACGSSSHSGTASARANGFVKFAVCMRSHGVPDFPDPSSGGGIQITPGPGVNPQSPSFQSAQATCSKLLPGGGPGSRHPSEQVKTEMLHTSECMRSHGVTGFPDPTLTRPNNPSAYSLAIDRGGVVLAVPKSIDVTSPAFRHAAAACGFAH